jgi:hypothetical protein
MATEPGHDERKLGARRFSVRGLACRHEGIGVAAMNSHVQRQSVPSQSLPATAADVGYVSQDPPGPRLRLPLVGRSKFANHCCSQVNREILSTWSLERHARAFMFAAGFGNDTMSLSDVPQ